MPGPVLGGSTSLQYLMKMHHYFLLMYPKAYHLTYSVGGSVLKTIKHYINISLLNPHWVKNRYFTFHIHHFLVARPQALL